MQKTSPNRWPMALLYIGKVVHHLQKAVSKWGSHVFFRSARYLRDALLRKKFCKNPALAHNMPPSCAVQGCGGKLDIICLWQIWYSPGGDMPQRRSEIAQERCQLYMRSWPHGWQLRKCESCPRVGNEHVPRWLSRPIDEEVNKPFCLWSASYIHRYPFDSVVYRDILYVMFMLIILWALRPKRKCECPWASASALDCELVRAYGGPLARLSFLKLLQLKYSSVSRPRYLHVICFLQTISQRKQEGRPARKSRFCATWPISFFSVRPFHRYATLIQFSDLVGLLASNASASLNMIWYVAW